ncbi:hypothetical protein M404DRAFT_141397, partial [Pisolithus tinctorius Marx 270]
LSNKVELAIGMEVMVTFNVATDLDLVNGAQGHVVDIMLDSRECVKCTEKNIVQLQYPPLYVLVEMKHTRVNALEGLCGGMLPVMPMCRTFSITTAAGK